jgi:hypothetical protein
MPLVAHNQLPAFQRLLASGQSVLSLERARKQDIRELHIGLLNMMPDAALTATEEQFIRLIGNCNQIAQFYVYPFSLPELNRGAKALQHIKRYYFDFEQLRDDGLDALIITGANVANPSLDLEPFWKPLIEVVRWAENNVASQRLDRGVVDQDVHRTESFDRPRHGRTTVAILGNVAANEMHAPGQVGGSPFVDVETDDASRVRSYERLANREPDAAAATGDDGNPAAVIIGHATARSEIGHGEVRSWDLTFEF